MIAALYVRKNGHYYGLPDVDPWDEAREAEHVVQLTREMTRENLLAMAGDFGGSDDEED